MGGIENLIYGNLREVKMRVPDNIQECVVFLCVKHNTKGDPPYTYHGTGFFLGMKSEKDPESEYAYLVTAKHCVENAKNGGLDLYIRINTLDSVEYVEIRGEWIYSEKADVAVQLLDLPDDKYDYTRLSENLIATDEILTEYDIGIGDDIVIAGLFTRHYGTKRNIPIVRSGIIAAMPVEPFVDLDTGEPYNAYLAELRSIGGLSGSPVFVYINGRRRLADGRPVHNDMMFLIGLVRAHWDYKNSSRSIDFGGTELDTVNMGIALLTPIQEALTVLKREDLVKERRQLDRNLTL